MCSAYISVCFLSINQELIFCSHQSLMLEQCLSYSRCSISICFINEWMKKINRHHADHKRHVLNQLVSIKFYLSVVRNTRYSLLYFQRSLPLYLKRLCLNVSVYLVLSYLTLTNHSEGEMLTVQSWKDSKWAREQNCKIERFQCWKDRLNKQDRWDQPKALNLI